MMQHEVEMHSMKSEMMEMRNEYTSELKKLSDYSEENINALKDETTLLKSALSESQSKLQYLTYNMQGIDDKQFVSLAVPEPNTEPVENADVDEAALPIKKKSKALDKEHSYFSIERKCPPTASGRWKWAISMIMQQNRLNALNVNFTQARVNKLADHSVVHRLARLEDLMFQNEQALSKNIKDVDTRACENTEHVNTSLTLGVDILKDTVGVKFGDMESSIENMKILLAAEVSKTVVIAETSAAEVSDLTVSLEGVKEHVGTLFDRSENLTQELSAVSEDVVDLRETLGSVPSGVASVKVSEVVGGASKPPLGESPTALHNMDKLQATTPLVLSARRSTGDHHTGGAKKATLAHQNKLELIKEQLSTAKEEEEKVFKHIEDLSDRIKKSTLDSSNRHATFVVFDNENTYTSLTFTELLQANGELRNHIRHVEQLESVLRGLTSVIQFEELGLSMIRWVLPLNRKK